MKNLTKSDFRKLCIKKLKFCSKFGKIKKDKFISKKILEVIKIEKPKSILLYIPLDMEVNVRSLINILRREKNYKVYVPLMMGNSLKVVPYRLPLNKQKYNIYEPNDSSLRVKIDLAIVPIVGTDDTFRRVGFGVGFYDRFFASLDYRPKIVFTQLCLCQSKTTLTQIHDIKSDYIITNKGTIWKR
ncbi:MAG: 5-formyltetrahydrofolate cyclo-ligase [Arcobacteraceae bacterium]|jgi:5-formyltetrahydrofolate cyclo-ligase|nr:5-formyltetrahydrofolate cyclo-ligase [Arcobacteraceae bacterium]